MLAVQHYISSFISSHLQGHCRDCKYKPVRCPNPGCSELMLADKLDSHVDGECQYRMVACNHCREETAANQLEVRLIWSTVSVTVFH